MWGDKATIGFIYFPDMLCSPVLSELKMIAFCASPPASSICATSHVHSFQACASDGSNPQTSRTLSRRAILAALAVGVSIRNSPKTSHESLAAEAVPGQAFYSSETPNNCWEKGQSNPSKVREPTVFVNDEPNKSAGFFKREFAATMDGGMKEYEARITERKRALFSLIPPTSTVLDIGIGTGPNLRYFPPQCSVIGVEPNGFMWRYASDKARGLGLQLTLCDAVAERLPLPDASVDVVVSTLTLCSVNAPDAALAEVARVLRPGGMFLFIEHVLASRDEPVRRAVQRFFNPLQRLLADGCNIDRDTESLIRRRVETGDFDRVYVDQFKADFGDPFESINLVAPHISGYARRSPSRI